MMKRFSSGLGFAVLVSLFLTGCTPQAGGDESTLSPELQDAQNLATSDLERTILADGVVDRAEYEEAVQAYLGCLQDKGVDATARQLPNTLFEYRIDFSGLDDQGNLSDEVIAERQAIADAAELECSEGTTAVIEALYASLVAGQSGEDILELTAACLVRHELVAAPFTGKDFQEWLNTLPENGSQPAPSGKTWNIDTEDPRFSDCQGDPYS